MKELSGIPVTVYDRKWLQHNKFWRLFFKLPPDRDMLPVTLTGMISKHVRIEIVAPDGTHLEVDPAEIVNVTPKGVVFLLVVETCLEKQNGTVGPYITAMYRQNVSLSILPAGSDPLPEKPAEQQKPGASPEKKRLLAGLHQFFKMPKYRSFIQHIAIDVLGPDTPTILDEIVCKNVFKIIAKVESCADLTEEDLHTWCKRFNDWVNR